MCKSLIKVISKRGFTYKQLVRSETHALYEQITKEGILAGHEIFKINILPEGDVFGTFMPEREAFPKDEAFGVSAWSVGIDRNRAILRYAQIVKEYEKS